MQQPPRGRAWLVAWDAALIDQGRDARRVKQTLVAPCGQNGRGVAATPRAFRTNYTEKHVKHTKTQQWVIDVKRKISLGPLKSDNFEG